MNLKEIATCSSPNAPSPRFFPASPKKPWAQLRSTAGPIWCQLREPSFKTCEYLESKVLPVQILHKIKLTITAEINTTL